MTRSQLIDALAQRLGIDRPTAEAIVHTVFQSMRDALQAGDGIELRGFGSFGVRKAPAYKGRNPRSGASVAVRARRMPYFKIGRPFRARIEQGALPAEQPEQASPPAPPRKPLALVRGRRPDDGVAGAANENAAPDRPLALRRSAE